MDVVNVREFTAQNIIYFGRVFYNRVTPCQEN